MGTVSKAPTSSSSCLNEAWMIVDVVLGSFFPKLLPHWDATGCIDWSSPQAPVLFSSVVTSLTGGVDSIVSMFSCQFFLTIQPLFGCFLFSLLYLLLQNLMFVTLNTFSQLFSCFSFLVTYTW
jgi:hypothetical protein